MRILYARPDLPSAVTADVTAEVHELTEEEMNERMSGNLCRCGYADGLAEDTSRQPSKRLAEFGCQSWGPLRRSGGIVVVAEVLLLPL
jgi:hypothetical protein